MDVQQARTFLVAAEVGSFAAAATRLNASASAVTERIKQLEHLLGARLFERDKRGCRLTQAGQRFLEPARAMVLAWEAGKARVGLPNRYRRTLRLGGQHALWPSLLIPWLQDVGMAHPDIALRAMAAAPAQLNRALAEDEIDMALLYDPVLRGGIRIEELASDALVLVSARPERDWREIFVRFDWGESASAEIMARMGELPGTGLDLELGVLSLDWLIASGGAGFVPRAMAGRHLRDGRLSLINDAPSVAFSPFVCWRGSLDAGLAQDLVGAARRLAQNQGLFSSGQAWRL